MKSQVFSIKCITNLHMGSGEVNFNIIDNEVEKDPVTNFPTMHSSGIKGALRDYCSKNNHDNVKEEKIDAIFGKGKGEQGDNAGNIKFLNGNLLFLAVRASSGDEIYHLVTCKEILLECTSLLKQVGILPNVEDYIEKLDSKKAYSVKGNSFGTDRFNYKKAEVVKIPDEVIRFFMRFCSSDNNDINKIVIIPSKDMSRIPLPIIARNKLDEKGNSEFLWYEEVVPHNSIFYEVMLENNASELINELRKVIIKDPIQFGGKASIGYGLCKLSSVDFDGEENHE